MSTQELLYQKDSKQKEFDAEVLDVIHTDGSDLCSVYLTQTCFFPTGGGQPNDTGKLAGYDVVDVNFVNGKVEHIIKLPTSDIIKIKKGDSVHGVIDWERRFDHMQQHSGQHLLTAVLMTNYGMDTVGFHLGKTIVTIDVKPGKITNFTQEVFETLENKCNQICMENRPVTIEFLDSTDPKVVNRFGLTGIVRVVTQQGLEGTACCGTHVQSTAEIGCVSIVRASKSKGGFRIEFHCGSRAFSFARENLNILTDTCAVFNTSSSAVTTLAQAASIKSKDLQKQLTSLAEELAVYKAKELWDEQGAEYTPATVVLCPCDLSPVVEATAKQFVKASKPAVFMAVDLCRKKLLMTSNAESGVNCGSTAKLIMKSCSGAKGGGNAVQGIVEFGTGEMPATWVSPAAVKSEIDKLQPKL